MAYMRSEGWTEEMERGAAQCSQEVQGALLPKSWVRKGNKPA